jgi:sugar phosphate permease
MTNRLQAIHKYRWYVFWILALQYLLVFFHRACPAVITPDLISAFGISGTALGLLASGYFYPYAFMQIPGGILADAWGAKKTITALTFLAAIGAILFGLAPNLSVAVAGRFLVGLGVSGVFVCSMKVFSTWFEPKRFARVSGIFIAVGGIGWLSASTPLAYLAQGIGWRPSLVLIGITAFIFTVLTWFIVADRPEDKGLRPILKDKPAEHDKRSFLRDMKTIWSQKFFWPLAAWHFMTGGAMFGFFALWAGPYLADTYEFSKVAVGNVLSMLAFAMIFSSSFLGYLSDSILKSRKKVLILSSIVNCLCWIVLLTSYYRDMPPVMLYIVFFLMGVTGSAINTIVVTTAKELFPVEIAGTSIGTINLFPFLGAMAFQPLIGHMLDNVGKVAGKYQPQAYKEVFILFTVTSICCICLSLIFKETFTKRSWVYLHEVL